MDVVAGFLGILIAILIVLAILGVIARRQVDLTIPLPVDHAREIAFRAAKGPLWANESGPGDINLRRRAIGAKGPTLSISVEQNPDGSATVSQWMSHWTSVMGIPNGPESILFRRWKVTRALRNSLESRTPTS